MKQKIPKQRVHNTTSDRFTNTISKEVGSESQFTIPTKSYGGVDGRKRDFASRKLKPTGLS